MEVAETASEGQVAAGEATGERVNPFAAINIREPRYVWDPGAHRYFGEECSFFFFRFRDTHGSPELDALRRVDEWLNHFQIRSKYVYKLFGYYDATARIWALPYRLAAFRSMLRAQSQEVLAVKEFSVTSTHLILREGTEGQVRRADLQQAIQGSLAQIQQLVACDRGIVAPEQRAALDVLSRTGIVHAVRVDPEGRREGAGCFRFAIIIKLDELQGEWVSLDQLVHFVKERNALPRGSGLIRCAVYQGAGGFGTFLVSGLISDHDNLVTFSNDLTRWLEGVGVRCRTETHLTAGSDSIECDVIDPTQQDATPSEERMLRFLASPQAPLERIREAVHALGADDRGYLVNIYRKHEADFIVSDFAIYFKDFLLSEALGDQRYLQRALMCLMELEGLLGDLWQKQCKARSAFRAVIDAANAIGLEKVDVKKLSLRQMIDITGQLANAAEGDWLVEVLGLPWRDVLRGLGEVRNDVAHGRLFVDSNYLSRNWRNLADQIGEVGTLYIKVRSSLASGFSKEGA